LSFSCQASNTLSHSLEAILKIFPQGRIARFLLISVLLLAGYTTWDAVRGMDRYFWPQSAKDRIENMASILRRIEAPARWCYPSDNAANLDDGGRVARTEIGKCLGSIKPAGDHIEVYPRDYMKRFYRANLGDKFCEVTLSTVYNDNRIVGSDCYYGLFPKDKDTGVGMTDDKFG
jgi:hypothetical protein